MDLYAPAPAEDERRLKALEIGRNLQAGTMHKWSADILVLNAEPVAQFLLAATTAADYQQRLRLLHAAAAPICTASTGEDVARLMDEVDTLYLAVASKGWGATPGAVAEG